MSKKQCSKCNTTFECGNEQAGCWCESLYLDMGTLNALKKEFDNCLCPTCLQTYSNNKPNK